MPCFLGGNNNGGNASRATANRMESGAVSLTSGCLIGVETNGVTGTPYRGVARMPESCYGDSPSLVRYHKEPGNYLRHATPIYCRYPVQDLLV